MLRFIYVFDERDRDKLLRLGYQLLQEDIIRDIYVFANQEMRDVQVFEHLALPCVETNTLTF